MLKIHQLNIKYKNQESIINQSIIEVKPGETIAFIIPNNGGKEYLFNYFRSNTLITFNNQSLMKNNSLFFSFQPLEKSDLSVLKYMAEILPKNTDTTQQILSLCTKYDLNPDKLKLPLNELSPFELMDIYLIIINIKKPNVVIMNNTWLYLVPSQKEIIKNRMKQLQKDLKFVLVYLTHRIEDIDFTNRALVIDQGKIMINDNYEQVVKQLPVNLAQPFYVNLSSFLKLYNLIEDDYFSMEELGEAIWK